MKRLGFALACVLGAAACGDNIKPGGTGGDGGPDGPPIVDPTFTTFVIDLVSNKTANDTQPVPFADFSTLPDPDGDNNNTAAYPASLFQ